MLKLAAITLLVLWLVIGVGFFKHNAKVKATFMCYMDAAVLGLVMAAVCTAMSVILIVLIAVITGD